ncbi:MAG TPA: TolC family protein [Thermoanaerobaculia bacterium]|jgi:outer membrane protein
MNKEIRYRTLVGVLLSSLVAASPVLGQAETTEPLTLRKAVELALERAPQLAAVRAEQDGERASARLAQDAYHPSAWITTSPGYTYGMPATVAGHVPSVVGIEVRQTIYDPYRRSAIFQAEAQASGMDGTVARSCQDTVEKALEVYARCWVDQALTDTAKRRVDAAETIRKRVEALAAEGRETDLDLERARLQAARARQKLLNAESDRDLDLLELKRLIGWPGSAPLTLAADPDVAVPELTSAENLTAARAADPELRSLSREVELLGHSARLENKRYAPIIEASASYQRLSKYNDFDKYYVTFTPDSVAVGVSIAIPVFTGGRFEDGRDRARARLEQVEAQRAARESDLELSVRRAEASVARSTAEKSLSRRSQGIEEQALSALQLLVREGRSELSDLDDRQIVLADADEEASRAALNAVLERARLLSLRGELARALLGADPPCLMPQGEAGSR